MAVSAAPTTLHSPTPRRPLLARGARMLLAYLILLALLVVYQQKAPRFTEREWQSLANQGMTLTIASLGQTIVVLTGGIDLSVGPMVSLSNSIVATMGSQESPDQRLALGIVVALLAGAAGGLINGLIIAYGRLQPIIVTLATGYIYAGIALHVRPRPGGYVPFDRADMVTGLVWGKVPAALILLLILVALWELFKRTRLSNRIISIGSSQGAAYMSGVDVVRTKIWAYTLAGIASAVAGLFLTAQTASGDANAGLVYTLNSIAAVVLGGASLAGGAGSFIGTIAGAYVLSIIPSVLYFFDFYRSRPLSQDLYKGSILLAAVALGALGVLRMRNRLDRL
ncbi:MAG TPA: ABC transporter permease [Thermomicrobiales bacterium]